MSERNASKLFFGLWHSLQFLTCACHAGSGATLSTPSIPVPPSSTAPAHSSPQPSAQKPSTTSTGHRAAPAADVAAEVDAELQHSLALVLSQDEGLASLAVLEKVLANLAASPGEARFRQLRFSNKKVQQCVVEVVGALDFLQLCGFVVDGEAGNDRWAP